MTMSSPVLAMLWENWRLTRVEAAWRLTLGIVGSSAVLVWFAAVAPNEAARSIGATVALGFIVWWHSILWVSIAKLNGGRFLDGYRPGFPLYLLYPRPVRTAVLVGVPMAYAASAATALYLVSALLLRAAFGYPFPLLPVAAWIATLLLVQAASYWTTRSRIVQWFGMMTAYWACVILALRRAFGEEIAPAAFHPDRWPTLFEFTLADYSLIAAIGLVSFGVSVAGVARQRRGDARAAIPQTVEWRGFSDWLAGLFRFPCPAISATRAQMWFDLKSSGLPVLAIGGALAIVIPLLFLVTTQIDVVLSGFYTRPATRVVAAAVVVFSLPAVLLLGGNAFGIRARQGRTYVSAFDATQACGTARMAGLKVLVRSVCLMAALLAVGTSVWISASAIPFDVLDDNDTIIEKSRSPFGGWMRAVRSGVGAMSAYELLALTFVTVIVVAVMVASRAAFTALRARYPRQLNIAGSLLLLYVFVLVLLFPAEQYGIASQFVLYAAQDLTNWVIAVVAAASVLATVYLFWTVLAERLLTPRQACGAILVSAAFGAAWMTVLTAAGVPLSAMPARDAIGMLSPALLPLMASVLAPWSLSRIRHT